jgi:hypothetical protein
MIAKNKEERKKGGFFRFIFLITIPTLIIIVVLTYTVVNSISVLRKVHEWQKVSESASNSPVMSGEEWQLVRNKTFLTAKLALAANDSLGLTINLKDSLVQLETKGVVMRQVHFDEAEISNFFRSFEPALYARTFSKPFKISGFGGTIVKEPITVVKAPKDSIEAAKNKPAIDTTQIEFVEWHMILNKSLVISFVQSDREFGKMNKIAWQYRYDRYKEMLTRNLKDMIHFKIPVFYPQITIFIPKNEAKSFYRALSKKGEVVIRL